MLKANSYYAPPGTSHGLHTIENYFSSIDDREIRERAYSFDRFCALANGENGNTGAGEDLGYLCRRILAGDDLISSECFGYRQLFGKSLMKPQVLNVTPHAVSKSLSIFLRRILIKSSQSIQFKEFNILQKYKIFERGKIQPLQKRFTNLSETLSNRFHSSRQSVSPEEMPHLVQPQQVSIPSLEIITKFISDICHSTQMEYECSVASLIYLKRFMEISHPHLQLNEYNWRSIVLASMLTANKMWDDFHVANVAYCSIFPGLTLERVNELERGFLNILEYKTWISPSCYAESHFTVQACIAEDEIKHMKEKYSSAATGTVTPGPGKQNLTKEGTGSEALKSSVSIGLSADHSHDPSSRKIAPEIPPSVPQPERVQKPVPNPSSSSSSLSSVKGADQHRDAPLPLAPIPSPSQPILVDPASSLGFAHQTCQFIERERKTLITNMASSREAMERSCFCLPFHFFSKSEVF
jgi:ribosomal protein S18